MSEPGKSLVLEMRGVNVTAMRDPGLTVLENVDWAVGEGEFWVVAGQQHSGKTDLLMLAAGLIPPVAGSYRLFGAEPTLPNEGEKEILGRAGLVFQGGQLFNQMTVAENVALAVCYHGELSVETPMQEVREWLDLMELLPLADLTPPNIAANWRQRVALARALILRPQILLLDNPLSGLGARHRHWWLRFLEQLARGHKLFDGKPLTMVATTDDLRPWQNDRRQFALLNERKFTCLGGWREVEATEDVVVQELMSAPMEPKI